MELKNFIDLFWPFGYAYVVYWSQDSEEDNNEPLWKGNILDTPYWIIKGYKIGRYSNDWDSAVDLRASLGDENKDMAGLIITLIDKNVVEPKNISDY